MLMTLVPRELDKIKSNDKWQVIFRKAFLFYLESCFESPAN